VSPSPTTAQRVWRDSDSALWRCNDPVQPSGPAGQKPRTTRGVSFRKSTELGHDKTRHDELLDQLRTV
jgi:hypothetical protein